jgi:pimeloyl-ACP methyl ester carboxylesterase
MVQPIIHFAHANGFPAKVYSEIFRKLAPDFKIIYKDLLAHDERFPIVSSWMKSGEEIVDFISANTSEKVIGVGHSFGATSTLNAAFLRPDLFKGLILIEPVIMNGWQAVIFSKIVEVLGITHHFTPAKKSKEEEIIGRIKKVPFNILKTKPYLEILTLSVLVILLHMD